MTPFEQELVLKLNEKLDNMQSKMNDLLVVSVKQEINLALHMKRSQTTEDRLDIFENEVKPILEGFKFIKKIGTFAVGLAAIIKAISFFWK